MPSLNKNPINKTTKVLGLVALIGTILLISLAVFVVKTNKRINKHAAIRAKYWKQVADNQAKIDQLRVKIDQEWLDILRARTKHEEQKVD